MAAGLESLRTAQEHAKQLSRKDVRKKKSNERAILKAFQQSKQGAEKLTKWQGPDVESVPIAIRCIVPLRRLLRVNNFAKELNAAHDFLNTTSGAVYLPTGQLIPHHPSNMLSKESSTDYEGPTYPSPLIDEFMLQVQTAEIIPILQMTLGYGITGHSKEKQFIIMYGPSNSSKTMLVAMLSGAIGPYCVTMDRNCVIGAGSRSEGAATPHLVKLEGAHIAVLRTPRTKTRITLQTSSPLPLAMEP
jgi:phage/plasmid-associated DNA primase